MKIYVLAYVFTMVSIVIFVVVVASSSGGEQPESRPSVQLIQPIHVDVDSQALVLSVLLAAADHYDGRCEEDEYYWFTGDFDGDQWVRKCVPVDVLFVQ